MEKEIIDGLKNGSIKIKLVDVDIERNDYPDIKVCRLIYDIETADRTYGVNIHPQKEMRRLGLTYKIGVPQTISSTWDFWGCDNIPNDLPEYIHLEESNPFHFIGWGLSEEEAKYLSEGSKK